MRDNISKRRYFIYARVATKDQLAMDGQVNRLKQYATAKGYDLVGDITDNGVTSFQNQSSLDTMLRLAQEGKIDAVLCVSPSRISRDGLCAAAFEMELQRHSVSVNYLPPYDQGDYREIRTQLCMTISAAYMAVRQRSMGRKS